MFTIKMILQQPATQRSPTALVQPAPSVSGLLTGGPLFFFSVFAGINTRGEKPAGSWRVQRCCRAQLAQFGMTMRIGVGDALTHQPGVHLVVGSEPQPRREERITSSRTRLAQQQNGNQLFEMPIVERERRLPYRHL